MLIKIITGLITVTGLFLIYVNSKPGQFSYSRSLQINAPPEIIFPHLSNPKKMDAWMPWATVDPKMKMEYSGPEEGVGSRSSWISEGQMGTGSVTITEVLPYRSVKSKIEYKKPFEAVQLAEMAIETANGASLVTWSVTGESTFVQKLVSTFLDMEQMIGDNFVQGLTKLKMITENTNK